MTVSAICRDCLADFDGEGRCPGCRSPRVLCHPEIASLGVAHVDADAFYAAVEKRDDSALTDKPVIIGGGRRGVVSTACYVARMTGVRSAMPMFKARALCPDAVVLRPRMSVYAEVSRQIRAMMEDLTPLVEPLSLDEAFLDLRGTARLHGSSPALTLMRLQARIERDLGITVSIGLSHNKFLAKIASEREKPRGFSLIGLAETDTFLAGQPVGVIWGVGRAATTALEAAGIRSIADLRARDRKALVGRFGSLGDRLWHLAHGIDDRPVRPERGVKSISHETTFNEDLADLDTLKWHLWSLSEQVSDRAKARGSAGRTVTLKLKRADHRILTRRHSLSDPTCMAERIYAEALPMLQRDMTEAPFRLIGIGISGLHAARADEEMADLLDLEGRGRLAAERAKDAVRAKFGPGSILMGRSLR